MAGLATPRAGNRAPIHPRDRAAGNVAIGVIVRAGSSPRSLAPRLPARHDEASPTNKSQAEGARLGRTRRLATQTGVDSGSASPLGVHFCHRGRRLPFAGAYAPHAVECWPPSHPNWVGQLGAADRAIITKSWMAATFCNHHTYP
jgi:hypothetical protein